jgi:hypothetical protein
MGAVEHGTPGTVRLSAADPEDLAVLHGELRGLPGLRITAEVPGAPGEQGGVVDVLTVACASGGAVTMLIQAVRTVVASRGRGVKFTARRGDDEVSITAANADDAVALLRELMDGR